MIKLAIAGGAGRLGGRIIQLAHESSEFTPVAILVRADDPRDGGHMIVGEGEVPYASRLDGPCDVLVDVSTPDGSVEWAEVATRLGTPLVSGVTGHSVQQFERMRKAAKTIPVVHAPNFSVGMRVLIHAARRIASQLGEDFNIEIVETHHRHKVDAPSGSAIAILESLQKVRAANPVYGREGRTGPRDPGAIGIHALRMGEVVGQHDVHFGGTGETLTVSHHALSRDTFASGALRAASWILNRNPGLYAMDDVLGLGEDN